MKKELIGNSTGTEEKKTREIIDVIGDEPETNRFYGGISLLYRIAEFLILGMFLIFIVISAIRNPVGVTYSNLEFIVRNFAVRLDENSEKVSEILYNPDADMTFSLFGGGIAVCGNSGLTVFSATGRRTLSYSFDMRSPIMMASDKYILVFENGGSEYRLFNAFSQVYESKTDYPVRGASIASNGYYALITKTGEYSSCVEVYDSNFKLRGRYLKNGYIICTSFNSNATQILIATLSVNSEGRYLTELMSATLGNESGDTISFIEDDFPIGCSFRNQGSVMVCTKALYCFNENGETESVYRYGARNLSFFSLSDTSACLVLENNTSAVNRTRTAQMINYRGEETGSYTTDTAISSVRVSGDVAYILQYGLLTVIKPDGIIPQNLTSAIVPVDVLAYKEGNAYICCRSAAYHLRIDMIQKGDEKK